MDRAELDDLGAKIADSIFAGIGLFLGAIVGVIALIGGLTAWAINRG